MPRCEGICVDGTRCRRKCASNKQTADGSYRCPVHLTGATYASVKRAGKRRFSTTHSSYSNPTEGSVHNGRCSTQQIDQMMKDSFLFVLRIYLCHTTCSVLGLVPNFLLDRINLIYNDFAFDHSPDQREFLAYLYPFGDRQDEVVDFIQLLLKCPNHQEIKDYLLSHGKMDFSSTPVALHQILDVMPVSNITHEMLPDIFIYSLGELDMIRTLYTSVNF